LPLSDNHVEIKDVVVKPGLQGQGIGSFLITEVMTIAKKENFSQFVLAKQTPASGGKLYIRNRAL
jgi:GNAT superfamily N-acetyltransferase